MSNFFDGICYSAFPAPYNPSMANTTCLFFGSDIAYDPMEPLWGKDYTSSSTGSECSNGRDDVKTMADMGVSLIRLYDWEPRNDHLNFLDHCHSLGVKVLVPVSNYFLTNGFSDRAIHIPDLIKSFSNKAVTDYHPAIAGIIIGNEPGLNGFGSSECADFTLSWVQIEQAQFKDFSMPIIGHPVDFGLYGGKFPCWGFWKSLLNHLNGVTTRNLDKRLFLAPQTYNDSHYLFTDAGNGASDGFVDITADKFKKPILFTEIGQDRTKDFYQRVIQGQLGGAHSYASAHPGKLLGVCFFQFADKVWQKGTSEDSFGAFSHSDNIKCTVEYGSGDFTHWDAGSGAGSKLEVDELVATPIYSIVKSSYGGDSGIEGKELLLDGVVE